MPHLIRFWAYDGVLASGVCGPIDVLTAANALAAEAGRGAPFRWRIESPDGRPVRTASGQMLAVDGQIDPAGRAQAVLLAAPFVGDMPRFLQSRRAELAPIYEGLRRQHAAGALVGAHCVGSFLLAEAGLLTGRSATTHWRRAKDFARRYPKVRLKPNEVLTLDGGVLCAGAVTAYFHLALKLVEILASPQLAAGVARLLLIDSARVSQGAFAVAELIDDPIPDDAMAARAQQWLRTHFGRRVRLADLAQALGVSERTLNRRFQRAVGEPPMRHLQAVRLGAAKDLLAEGRLGVETVGLRVGYEDASAFRALFKRETGLSPRDFQRRHARPTAA